jgi:hypothetical protein
MLKLKVGVTTETVAAFDCTTGVPGLLTTS